MWRRVAYGLIGAAILGGFVILSTPASGLLADLGTALLSVALLAVIGLIMLQLGPRSGSDRERELQAREEFDRTGRWPDD
jgi:radical SAM superfamily enzyme YgiQ (UPF0313 family)